jgi:DNA repair protein RadA/Sms
MVKVRAVFRCGECGGSSPKWVGRCPTCGEWNTLVEEIDAPDLSPARLAGAASAPSGTPVPIAEVDTASWAAAATGMDEVDRVLSGGLVPGSVTLVGGEPGIGKSTLLLQVVDGLVSRGARALYVSAEESTQQVRLRADRLGTLRPHVFLVAESSVPHIVTHLDTVSPDVVVIDSIQTVFDPQVASAPGSVTQVRESAARLVHEAKSRGVAVVLVGHVTKDGSLAGPRVLEHVVDTVLTFEGDRHHGLRMLRAVKHRFGSTDELGLFEMTEQGLLPVPDPSALFLADRRRGVSGSAVVPTMEGHRPLLVELQALVNPSPIPTPRRSAQGVDSGRLALLTAVLGRRARLVLTNHDVYALAVGGVRVVEPAADLGLCLAIASSLTDVPLPSTMVACGEVGLGGEIRQVAHLERRLNEAARLGFTEAIVPLLSPEPPAGVEAIRVATLREAVDRLGID